MTPVDIFCDFDGTISMNDMIGQILLHFAPEAARPIIDRVVSQTVCVKEGVEQMFALLPSSRYEEMVQFAVATTKLRPGFASLVRSVIGRGGRFVVVSGGFDFFVLPALAGVHGLVDVHCNRLDTTGPFLRVVWDTLCDTSCDGGCGLCKPTLLRRLRRSGVPVMAIGDGVTDVKLARLADGVFARDKLVQVAEREGIPYTPFETFFEIEQALA
jgi:2-hydroxy-3-keto-5-methylthiopentenyl-1-phosphate phosphatase